MLSGRIRESKNEGLPSMEQRVLTSYKLQIPPLFVRVEKRGKKEDHVSHVPYNNSLFSPSPHLVEERGVRAKP